MKRGKALTQITDAATPIWHCLTTEECADKLTSDTSTGLSAEAATARQLQAGRNIIQERARRGRAESDARIHIASNE